MTDKFVDQFLTHEGESVEDAKARLAREQEEREAAGKEAAEKRRAEQQALTGVQNDIGRASVESSLKMAKASVEASKKAGKRE